MKQIATYTLRIMGPVGASEDGKEALDSLSDHGALQHAEDAVNDALPDGYYAKIDEVSHAPA